MATALSIYRTFRFALNVSILVACCLHVVTLLVHPSVSVSCYRLATLSAIVGYGASLWWTQRSKLQLNLQAVQALLSTVDAQYFFHTVAFYLFGYKNLMLLIPLAIFAFYSALSASKHVVQPTFPSLYTRFVEPTTAWATAKASEATLFAALTEVMLGVFLIFGLFSRANGVMHVLVQWNFLAQRYRASSETRTVFALLRQRLDAVFLHPRCPAALGRLWSQLAAFLSRLAQQGAAPAPAR
eukprot:EG_transcript_21468